MSAPVLWTPPAPDSAHFGSGENLTELFDACYDDPQLFFEEVLRVKPRRWQREINEEIAHRRHRGEDHTKVLVRAAHQSGKTFEAGGLCLWWGATRPGCRILTTAPIWRLVEELLWSEIRKLYEGGLLAQIGLGRLRNDCKWDMGGGWFAVGASSDNPANLEGQHSVIAAGRFIDEAKTVPDSVFTATQGLLASMETLDVWISTPSTRTGMFYKRDLTGGDEVIRKIVTIDELIADDVPGAARWKEDSIIEYGGTDNFEYQSRAMGAYIDDAEGALFPFSWIERAMLSDKDRTRRNLPVFHVHGPATIGYDVAGSTDGDENATAPTHGPDSAGRFEVDPLSHWHQHDTQISKDRVIEHATSTKARCIRADVQGLGKGVCDAIAREVLERSLKMAVDEYRAADPAEDPDRFLNRKAENAWSMRLLMERDGLRLPNEPKLREQMAAMKYEVRQGKIRIIDPKEDSPDHFDAVLIGLGNAYAPLTMQDISFGKADAPYEYHTTSGWGDA